MFRILIVTALALIAMPTLANAKLGAPTAANKDDAAQKIRCKSEEVTGSLAARRRTCMTVAQWQEQAERAQRDATKLVDHGTICTGASCSGG